MDPRFVKCVFDPESIVCCTTRGVVESWQRRVAIRSTTALFRRPRLCALLIVIATVSNTYGADQTAVDFNRDIRPLFSNHCFKCHGPDEDERQAELRLDTREGILSSNEGPTVVVPGRPDQSELLQRLESEDPEQRMPPPDANLDLNSEQIGSVRRWIEQGAEWKQHWSFVAPRQSQIPEVPNAEWARNPIDHFVLDHLSREGLSAAPPADKTTLIRRVTLDLTGLPPTPEQVDAFLADSLPNAYERFVDQLLQSPRFGERMALVWLDAARYADTSGYQNDGPRSMWRWRDWVIEAYNRGLPFDQFTVEQLAGDLLPQATREQRIATGFNRNHRGNSEGGVIAEEFQVEYVVDRVETTATVWLGLTLGCSRCHEHKYDPITQQEFYQFYAFFNNIPEYGRAVKEGNSPPTISAPTRMQQRQLAILDGQLATAQQKFERQQEALRNARSTWAASWTPAATVDWSVEQGRLAHFSLDEVQPREQAADSLTFRNSVASDAPGRRGKAIVLDGKGFADAGDVGDFGYFDSFSLSAWIHPAKIDTGTILSRMTDVARGDGYYVQLADGQIQVNLVKRWLDDSTRVQTTTSVPVDAWTHVLVTYDGSRVAQGITVYLNGQSASLKTNLDLINQSFASKEPFRIGGGGGPAGRFVGMIDEVSVFDRCLAADEAMVLATPEAVSDIAKMPNDQRSPAQQLKLETYFLLHHAPAEIRVAYDQLAKLRKQRVQLIETFPTVMVMQEMAQPRQTCVLTRGEYDKPADPVSPGVPAVFPALRKSSENVGGPNRLDLAHWLTDASNPLTPRVAVNRYWQVYFGAGLVRSAEDFGTQGERPSHPRLLDWLAAEFVRRGWDVKSMQRLIVTSATYRQSSRVSTELLARDPENRLLARGPRFRLAAETVRDQALAASGLLSARIGGPSVKPYQPDDLWKDIATVSDYVQDHGANLYRRSMYTYWKRTVVPPAMATFDALGREMCNVRPRRTNTPLQALTLMNDITFVEAARVLAQRVLAGGERAQSGGEREAQSGGEREAQPGGEREAQPSGERRTQQQLSHLFRLVLSRSPSATELRILHDSLARHRAEFGANQDAAAQLVGSGEYPQADDLDVAELAAYTAVASLILNLDETVTKQ